MTKGAPLLRFKNATLGYGGSPVLTKVDLSVEAGDFWGILGHNGSGKTTIVKAALGLIPCARGEVTGRAPRFGYVPQKERLDPLYPLSALAVAEMGAWRGFAPFRGAGGEDGVRRCLAECGAAELAARRFSDLSGGQKQRVLIARALAAEPELLVLDEPLAGVDITTQRALLDLLQALKDKRSLTILMVSHRVSAEKGMFTHLAWVEDGLVTTGSSAEMLSKGRLSEVFKSEL